jgi:hypothetical protein
MEVAVLVSPNLLASAIATNLIPYHTTIIYHDTYVKPIPNAILIFCKPVLYIAIFFVVFSYV